MDINIKTKWVKGRIVLMLTHFMVDGVVWQSEKLVVNHSYVGDDSVSELLGHSVKDINIASRRWGEEFGYSSSFRYCYSLR